MLSAPPPLDGDRTALFLDLDGTLAELRPRPGDVGPDPTRALLLERVANRMGGAVAVISGRALDDLDRILGGGVTAVAAVHGMVRRHADGSLATGGYAPLPPSVREAVGLFSKAYPAVLVEDKGPALALHYRAAPWLEERCRALAGELAALAGLKVQLGDMVAEIRQPGATKAEGVAAFMLEPPFLGRTPVFVGDDLTDEDGFAGAERAGGFGVVVGPRRPSRAKFTLPNVAAVLRWLGGVAPPERT